MDDDALAARLGKIADQYTESLRRGENPDIEAYARSNPELAALLRQVLPTIAALRSAAPGPAGASFSMPSVLGDFRLVREIGRGGMGIVYEAEQLSFPRKVALKLLPAHPTLDAKYLARFEREARTAAGLHHTHIVPVYAVGCEQGIHYYAMQFVAGPGLDQLLAAWRAEGASPPWRTQTPSSRRQARARRAPYFELLARIGMQVAEALDYAHQRGIVHRDIKPSNILLQIDAREASSEAMLDRLQSAIPKITDFGLVKTLDESDNLTRSGDVVGTARYMSPEQTSARRGPVDGRTDVYSLGVTLYELLTLQPAFDGPDQAALWHQLATGEPVAIRQRNPAVPRDLETIVAKAMAKSPADRYATAGELAAELRRFLAGEPIRARPLTLLERCRRWCRRNPVVAGLGAAVALSLLAGSIVSSYFAVQASFRAQEAIRERDRAEASEQQVRREKQLGDRHLYVAHMNLVQQAWERGHIGRVRQLLAGLEPAAGPDDLRGFDWHYFHRQSHHDLGRWPAHEHAVGSIAYSPAGRLLATGCYDGTIKTWDPDRGLHFQTLKGHGGRIAAIAFAPEGLTLASAGQDGTVKLWDVASGALRRTLELGEPVEAVAFAADGRLAAGTADGTIQLFDAEGTPAGSMKQPGSVRALAFAPDGQALASASADHTVKLWDVTIGLEKATLRHGDSVSAVAFAPDGATLACAEGDHRHLFLPRAEPRSRPGGPRSRPGEVKLWDVASGLERASLRRHAGPVYCLAYHPQGERLASAGDDMSVVIWDTAGTRRTQLLGHLREVNAVAISPDGRTLGSASDDRTLCLWDIASGQLLAVLRHLSNVKAIAFAPDGARFAAGGGDRLARVWSTADRQQLLTLRGHTMTVRSIAFSPDGQLIATGAGDPYRDPPRPGEVILWDAASGERLAELKGHGDVVRGVAFSPDGQLLASGSDDRVVKLWDCRRRTERTTITLPDGVRSVAFSPDSRTLAIAGGDSLQNKPGEVVLWDVARQERRAVLEGHRATVLVVAFLPDGQTLATGSTDGTVRIWDAVTGQERALLEGHQGLVRALAAARDGKILATGDNEAMIRLWFAK